MSVGLGISGVGDVDERWEKGLRVLSSEQFTFSRQHIDIGVAHLPTGAFSAPPNTNTSYDDDDPDPLVATAQNGDLGSGTSAAPDASCE